MNSFMNQVKGTLDGEGEHNMAYTENMALGYRTTSRSLLDANFRIPQYRRSSEDTIVNDIIKAFAEDRELTLKWLFFARDVREGLGERRLFRVIMKHFAIHQPKEIQHLIQYTAEYGRWDDLVPLLDTPLSGMVVNIIREQLAADQVNMRNGDSISLMAKWLPSINSASKETRRLGTMLAKELSMTEKSYRKMLSSLRGYLDVIERKMSRKEWGSIDYSKVPSKANLLYNKAFWRNDKERREAFIESLVKGEATINSSVAFPHDIIHKYMSGNRYGQVVVDLDHVLEEMWKALPNTVEPGQSTIVVADGSGSMTDTVGGTNVMALTVANALAIYFSERLSGDFKDRYITFSSNPKFVDFSGCATLREKLMFALQHNEISNTNLEKVFGLILETAIRNRLHQEDLPANILVISDMEFDCPSACQDRSKRLFKVIEERFSEAGYKIPKLIFWNVNSRSGAIPVKENELGVALVSGFSVNIAKMVTSGKLDPFECLLETLMSERYECIKAAS